MKEQSIRTSDIIIDKLKEYVKDFGEIKTLKNSEHNISLAGALSYIIGFDFVSQSVFNKNTTEAAINRLKEHFGDDQYKVLVDELLEMLDLDFVNSCEEWLKEVNEQMNDRNTYFNNLQMSAVRKLLDSGYVDTMYAVDVHNLLNKDTITHTDVLKFNNLISSNVTYINKGVATETTANKFADLYNVNKKFSIVKAVEEAVDVFNNIKASNIATEAIVSLYDFCQLHGKEKISNILKGIETITDTVQSPISEDSRPSVDESITAEPYQTLLALMNEISGKDIESADDFVQALELLTEDDNAGYVYQFLKKMESADISYNIPFADQSELIDKVSAKLDEHKEVYKKSVETICQPIPADKKRLLNNAFNIVINNTLLETDDVREYLITQYIDSVVETYKHASEIMTAIEKSKIRCSKESLKNYVFMFNQYKEIVEKETGVSECMINLEKLNNKIPMYDAMIKFLK